MHCLMTHKGYILSLDDSFETLMEFNVLFFGEEHGSRIAHEAESILLTGLADRDPRLVLALEMFERDVQNTLDDYLNGNLSEEEFLDRSRPWPDYQEDYRPLIEFAKSKGIPVIAANVPRKAAAAVSASNRISTKVVGPDAVYLPKRLHWDSDEYRERFMATLKTMPSMGPMKRIQPEALYKAQVLKDTVMADSLEPFLGRRILFCCGHFHSDYHLGIPHQLSKNHPELRIAVITMASVVENLPMKERSRVADFIWIDE